MAEVFLATSHSQLGAGSVLALKRILPHFTEDEKFVSMFTDEARIASSLFHRNICEIYDQGTHDGQLYIVMQYVHGKDLHVLRHRAARLGDHVPADLATHIVAEIAEALAYAHSKKGPHGEVSGIVHRDVSPPNILVGYDGVAKLIDFGIAQSESKLSQTQTGRIKGKFAYMSPEQARGKALDGRSDIFSLGIVFYELLTGELPFPGTNQFVTLKRIAEGDLVPPLHAKPDMPPELAAIIERCLARDPAHRYPTAAALAADLRGFLRLHNSQTNQESVSAYLRRLFRHDYIREQQHIKSLLDGAPVELGHRSDEAQSSDVTRVMPMPYLAAGYEEQSVASAPSQPRQHFLGATMAESVEIPVDHRALSAAVLEEFAPTSSDTDPNMPMLDDSSASPENAPVVLPARAPVASPLEDEPTAPILQQTIVSKHPRNEPKAWLWVALGAILTAVVLLVVALNQSSP